MNSIAVLVTSFNRREITLRCLRYLFASKPNVAVYLVDDNSNDGTYEAIEKDFPQVHLIKGTGNLYWNRGMHRAWEEAAKFNYDYYLWLNDDVILYEHCFDELFYCSNELENKAVISGVIENEDKTRIIYGGTDKNKKILVPDGKMLEVTLMNGNVVLVPKNVFEKLGNLDPVFHHDSGDVDYGLRAKKKQIKVYTTRKPVGCGETNNICRTRLANSTIKKRFIKLYSPLGFNPNINYYFRKKHFGLYSAISYYIFLHLLNLLPDKIVEKYLKNYK